MGTWGAEPFANDAALDWKGALETGGDASELLRKTLEAADDAAEEAVAAATVVAAAAAEPVRGLPADVKAWVRRRGFVPDRELIDLAASVLIRISTDSELADRWAEAGELASWSKATDRVLARLREAAISPLPERAPAPVGMPRSLPKMVERWEIDPSDSLRTRLAKAFARLDEIHVPSKESGYELPLILAARAGLVEETRLLLKRGACPEGQPGRETPLAAGCAAGHLEVAAVLLDHGARLFEEILIDAVTRTPMEFVIDPAAAEPVAFRYAPALFAVARRGTAEAIDFLVARGADPSQTDLNGETLLFKAVEVGNLDTAVHLLALGLDVDAAKPTGERALHYAVRAGQLAAVEVLLAAGADVNALDSWRGKVDAWDISPLDLAEETENSPMITLLRKFGGKRSEELLRESD